MSCGVRAITCLASGLALAFTTAASLATPLEKEVCSDLKEEHGQLVAAGAKANMERGPAWAKAKLQPDQIKQIERIINVEEQLAFRCPQPKPPLEQAENPAPAATVPGAAAASEPHKRGNPSAASRPLRKAKALSTARAANQTERRRSKKTPPRPKSSDAYVPPPKLEDAYTPPANASLVTQSAPPAQRSRQWP